MSDESGSRDPADEDPESAGSRRELEFNRPRWWETALVQQVPVVGPFVAEYQKAMWQEEGQANIN